jgi:hypothetical protein
MDAKAPRRRVAPRGQQIVVVLRDQPRSEHAEGPGKELHAEDRDPRGGRQQQHPGMPLVHTPPEEEAPRAELMALEPAKPRDASPHRVKEGHGATLTAGDRAMVSLTLATDWDRTRANTTPMFGQPAGTGAGPACPP